MSLTANDTAVQSLVSDLVVVHLPDGPQFDLMGPIFKSTICRSSSPIGLQRLGSADERE